MNGAIETYNDDNRYKVKKAEQNRTEPDQLTGKRHWEWEVPRFQSD